MHSAIETLRRWGHHNNPVLRKRFEGYDSIAWENLKPEDDDGQALIASYQQFMFPEHETICRRVHNRDPYFDGELGPATTSLLQVERCGCPDFLAAEKATGSGSWRAGCTTQYPNNHGVYYHLDDRRMPSNVKSWWPQIVEWVHGAYAEIGLALVPIDNRDSSQIRLSFEILAGSVIGLAQLPPLSDAQSCHRGFFCKLDPGYAPNPTQVATLWAHEKGHNMRSGHISGDPVMHPSIRTGWNKTFRGTTFGNRLSDWFGGEPIPGDGPPDNPDDAIIGEMDFTGGFQIRLTGEWPTKGKFFFTGMPK